MKISSSTQFLSMLRRIRYLVISQSQIPYIPIRVSRLKIADFVPRVVLECFEILSAHKEFYENQAALIVIQTMLRFSYCINKSLKDSTLFEKLIQSVSNILIRYIFLVIIYYQHYDTVLYSISLYIYYINYKYYNM